MATKSLSITHKSIFFLRRNLRLTSAATASLRRPLKKPIFSTLNSLFSTTSTPYPLQYEMVINRPTNSSRRPTRPPRSVGSDQPDRGFDNWVDRKLANGSTLDRSEAEDEVPMDKAQRKYYSKRRKRMYGSDSEDEGSGRIEDGFVELKPEIVEFDRLHKREEELYFYDAFAYPWEKDKHYKMVYQLEKKYFPDHCLDKAFLEPGESNVKRNVKVKAKRETGVEGGVGDDKGLVFFEEGEERKDLVKKDEIKDVTEKKVEDFFKGKKVEDFFKGLRRVPNKGDEVGNGEPYLVTSRTELPAKWDGPNGMVVLVNKPKGWTSFKVCGRLRSLVKVKKVGHAGTLDPMATGLLIVCVGKATKLADSYQGMIKGYSGVFRLGEATSTWDADSEVIQREPWEHIKDNDIKKAVQTFMGEIWQVPPMFSAIKVGGEKMYDKARRGESIELAPRRISIFQFDVGRSLQDRQNLIFRVTCSKGTYIRSLCADLGKALGSCAHLTALRRDSIGEYSADDAWEFQELEEAITKGYF